MIYHRSQNETKNMPHQFQGASRFGEVEYYNDLPGKTPPDFSTNAREQPLPATKVTGSSQDRGPGFRQRPFRGIQFISIKT